jgi:hypothetical protein
MHLLPMLMITARNQLVMTLKHRKKHSVIGRKPRYLTSKRLENGKMVEEKERVERRVTGDASFA